METASAGSSSPSVALGLPQQPRAIASVSSEPLMSSPGSGYSSSAGSGGSSSSSGLADDATAPSSDAADDSLLRHPKGKRKRTAAKDKAILEGAYLANPKPDKTARLDIVSQVSLNEKEVQIWFQNRRQNDRRKSRPLSPQEIAALRLGGMHAFSSDPPPSLTHSPLSYSSGGISSSPPHLVRNASIILNESSTTPLSSPELGPWEPDALARKQAEEQQMQQQQERDRAIQGSKTGAQTPSLSFPSSTSSIGYLANRWNAHSSFSTPSSFSISGFGNIGQDGCQDDLNTPEPFAPLSSATAVLPPPQPQHQMQRPSQRPFRISLSLDGKAEVIAGLSPSPPRRLPLPQPTTAIPFGIRSGSSSSAGSDNQPPSLAAIARSGLSRSQSAMSSLDSGLTLPPISSLTGSLESGTAPVPPPQPAHPPRLMRGRSRDVHAWVSVCNADTRIDDELSAQAQHEASGSAIAAISLLRSTSVNGGSALSSSSVLQPNGIKRNTAARPTTLRPGVKRPKLGRAHSSIARLQSVPTSLAAMVGEGSDKVWVDDEKKKKLKLSTLLSGNDSDKENWSPDEDGRPTTAHSQRPVGAGTGSSSGRRPLPSARSAQQQRAAASRVLSDNNISKNKDFNRSNSNLLAKRHVSSKSENGPSGGLDIYEDSSSDGGDGPLKRAPLLRAATIPGTADVEKFMRSGEASPSKKGDLDCVAGLLSLSQGIWR